MPYVDGFDYPVGAPDAAGYAITGWQYLEWESCCGVYHTGEDWNGVGGGDSDLGDPVYAIGNGEVVAAGNYGPGWGNIIVIEHTFPDGTVVWSRYAHEDSVYVSDGDEVLRGDVIGTIGRGYDYGGDWDYWAHLHFDILVEWQAPNAWVNGWSWSDVSSVYVEPSWFIEAYRVVNPCEEEDQPVLMDIAFPKNKTTSTFVRLMRSTGSDFVQNQDGQTVTGRTGKWFSGDFNGDGWDDLALVQRHNSTTYKWYVFENTGTGLFMGGREWSRDFGNDGDRYLIGDFNGDGIDDVCFVRGRSDGRVKIRVMLSLGDTFAGTSWWVDGFGKAVGSFMTGDVDGDGDDDVVMARGRRIHQLEWWVAESTGHDLRGSKSGRWNPDIGSAGDFTMVADFNGDGLADAADGRIIDEGTIKWRIGLSSGAGFGKATTWISDFGSTTSGFYTGDVNGDGRADLVYSDWWSDDHMRWRTVLSQGNSFGAPKTWEYSFGREDGVFVTGEFLP